MMSRRALALSTLALTAAAPALAQQAAEPAFTRYQANNFQQTLASGAPIVVHVHADWCPTCRAQLSAFSALGAQAFRGARLIRVDFDADKAFLQQYNVRGQSTILVFKGGREVGRIVGQSSREAVAQVLSAI